MAREWKVYAAGCADPLDADDDGPRPDTIDDAWQMPDNVEEEWTQAPASSHSASDDEN